MRTKRKSCKLCGKPWTRSRPISYAGYCPPCGIERQLDVNRQMERGEGPDYEKWQEGMRRAAGLQSTQ